MKQRYHLISSILSLVLTAILLVVYHSARLIAFYVYDLDLSFLPFFVTNIILLFIILIIDIIKSEKQFRITKLFKDLLIAILLLLVYVPDIIIQGFV